MNTFPRWLKVVFALTLLELQASGVWFYRAQELQATIEELTRFNQPAWAANCAWWN